MSGKITALQGLLFLFVSAAQANGPEVGRDAGMIFPLESTVVQLVAESVDVRFDYEKRLGTAECVYYLGNVTDSTQSFEMAFVTNRPFGGPGESQRFYDDAGMVVDIDGSDVPVRLAPLLGSRWTDLVAPPPDSLPVWNVTIDPRDTTRVHMMYRVSPSGGSDGNEGGMGLAYHCRPAALWAGTVGRAIIRFELDGLADYLMKSLSGDGESVCLSVRPSGWRRRQGAYEWRFENWEPIEDISVGVEWK